MRIVTPSEVAAQTQNKYLGVLVAAKFARFVNEFPRDRSVDFEEKLTTRAFDELVRGRLTYKLVRRRRRKADVVRRPARPPRRVGRNRVLQELHARPAAHRGWSGGGRGADGVRGRVRAARHVRSPHRASGADLAGSPTGRWRTSRSRASPTW